MRKEISFIFSIITELLEESSPNISEIFKEICTTNDKSKQELIQSLSNTEISHLIKALTLYHLLFNIIDEINSIKTHTSIKSVVDELNKQNYTNIQDTLKRLKFYPVFTAHPTESLRRTFLESYHQMYNDIESFLKYDNKEALEHLKYRLSLLWYSKIVREEKIEVLFELDNLLYFMESSILQSGTKVLIEIENILQTKLKKSPIKLGSWIGGDRDGNPFVNNKTMLEAAKIQHKTIIEHYIKIVSKLERELSCSLDYIKPTKELLKSIEQDKDLLSQTAKKLFLNEPLRAKLSIIKAKLNNKILTLNIPNPQSIDNQQTYKNHKELIKDIDMLLDSVNPRSGTYLREFRALVLLAGFHLMQLDFREHRDKFYLALNEIFIILGYTHENILNLPKTQKIEILNKALDEPIINLNKLYDKLSSDSRELVWAFVNFKWIKENISDSAIDSCIVSMTKNAEDLLCVLWFAKQSKLWQEDKKTKISISPLFETINDLENAPKIISELAQNKHYANYLKSRKNYQEIMIGYSDSSKDGGIFASNYFLRKAIYSLLSLEKSLGIKFRLFHGRGGSVSRGGLALEDALIAAPNNSVAGFFKVTEQGEVISAKYLNPKKAKRSFDIAISTILKKSIYDLYKQENKSDKYEKLLESISTHSYNTYRKLVYEDKNFIEYFKVATPIEFISQLNIGSRPSKRKNTQKIEDLRAIPWVFSWIQNRSIIPAWYGIGSALEANKNEDLQQCYKENLFFKTTIDNISQAFLKVDLDIAKKYHEFANNIPQSKNIWKSIENEYKLTLKWLCFIRGEKSLLQNTQARESILQRKEFLKNLSFCQIYLIESYKIQKNSKTKKIILSQIITTIVGIAQGIRNTG